MQEFEFRPGYLSALSLEELRRRAEVARQRLADCDLCPQDCHVDRSQELGVCRVGARARVISFIPHFGELPIFSGTRGSGTIYFSGSSLGPQASPYFVDPSEGDPTPRPPAILEADDRPPPSSREVEAQELAGMMLELQRLGCHNLNLISPSHVVAQILEAVVIAVGEGLHLPVIYNSRGYDTASTLELLAGVVDIYATDMLVGYVHQGRRYLKMPDYPRVNRLAIQEMYRQVGDLQLTRDGLAVRGLVVRHRVLPGEASGTARAVRFLARQISPETYLFLLDDFRPPRGTKRHPELHRRPSPEEMEQARELARSAGLRRIAPSPLPTVRLERGADSIHDAPG